MSFYNSYFKPKFKAFNFIQFGERAVAGTNTTENEITKSQYEHRLEKSRKDLIQIRKDFVASSSKFIDDSGKLINGVGAHIVDRTKYEFAHGWTGSMLRAGWSVLGGVAKGVSASVALTGKLVGATGKVIGNAGDSVIDQTKTVNEELFKINNTGFAKLADTFGVDSYEKLKNEENRNEQQNIKIRSVLQNVPLEGENGTMLSKIYQTYPDANPDSDNYNENFDFYAAARKVALLKNGISKSEARALNEVKKLTKQKNPTWIENSLSGGAVVAESIARSTVTGAGLVGTTALGVLGATMSVPGKVTQFVGNSFNSVFENDLSKKMADRVSNQNNTPNDKKPATVNPPAPNPSNTRARKSPAYQAQPNNPFGQNSPTPRMSTPPSKSINQPSVVDTPETPQQIEARKMRNWVNDLPAIDSLTYNLQYSNYTRKIKVSVRGEDSKYLVNVYEIDGEGEQVGINPLQSSSFVTKSEIAKYIGV